MLPSGLYSECFVPLQLSPLMACVHKTLIVFQCPSLRVAFVHSLTLHTNSCRSMKESTKENSGHTCLPTSRLLTINIFPTGRVPAVLHFWNGGLLAPMPVFLGIFYLLNGIVQESLFAIITFYRHLQWKSIIMRLGLVLVNFRVPSLTQSQIGSNRDE